MLIIRERVDIVKGVFLDIHVRNLRYGRSAQQNFGATR